MNFMNPKGCDRRLATWKKMLRVAHSMSHGEVGMETVVHEFVHDVTEECKETLEDGCWILKIGWLMVVLCCSTNLD